MMNQEQMIIIFKNSIEILRRDQNYHYNEYILQLFFLKLICDISKQPELIKEIFGISLYPNEAWSSLSKEDKEISKEITKIFQKIEKDNPIFKGVFINPQSNQWERISQLTLSKLIENFSEISFKPVDLKQQTRLIVDIFENLIIYQDPYTRYNVNYSTPSCIKKLMIQLAQPQPGFKICDPACGSGGILIECIRYLQEKEDTLNIKELSFYGQEPHDQTRSIALINLILYGVKAPNISPKNFIYNPILNQKQEPKKFNLVLSNPPFGVANWLDNENKKKFIDHKQFKYGLPPKNSADYAFIQRILQILDQQGKAIILVLLGVLFRGNIEGKIRQNIIQDDVIEAIIQLPGGLLYTTTIPTAIIIFNVNKEEKRRQKILIIDASHEYTKDHRQNILTTDNIDKICQTYLDFREESGYSAIANYEEIEKNNYSLRVNHYVQPVEKENIPDTDSQIRKLKELEVQKQEINDEIDECLRRLGFKI